MLLCRSRHHHFYAVTHHLEAFYAENYPSLLRFAERVLGPENMSLAEDCVQEAIYKVYCRRKEFSGPLAMKAHIFTCVHNEVISVRRKNDSRHRHLAARFASDF